MSQTVSTTRIACDLYAEVDGDQIRIMAEPQGHLPVCLMGYTGSLPEKCERLSAVVFEADNAPRKMTFVSGLTFVLRKE